MRGFTLLQALLLLSLVLSACAAPAQPAADAIPTAPLAKPVPTNTPAPQVALEDIVGWWTVSSGPVMLQIDRRGRMYGHYDDGGALLFSLWDFDVLSIVDGVLELHLHSFEQPCLPGQAGTYAVAVVSANENRWSMVEDPCGHREGAIDKAVLTRSSALEALIGRWVAGAQGEYMLTFFDDVQYQAVDASGGEATTVVSGAVYWHSGLMQLVVRDYYGSPCRGPHTAGTYMVEVSTDGKLTLEPVEDDCEARRTALSAWGPYTRSQEPTPLAGCFAPQAVSGIELCFTPEGVYRLHEPVANWAGGHPIHPHEGEYIMEGKTLRLVGRRGAVPGKAGKCAKQSGDYAFGLEGDGLTLTVVSDPCAERDAFFTNNPKWTRVAE